MATKKIDLDCGRAAIITGNRNSADVTICISRGDENIEKTWTRENECGEWFMPPEVHDWLSGLGLGAIRTGGWIAMAAERIGE